MLFKKEKPVIEINNNNEYLLWKLNINDIPYDTKLCVGDGCEAIYIENGDIKRFKSGQEYVINQKKIGKNKKMILVGSKVNYRFVLRCGTKEKFLLKDPTDRSKAGTYVGSSADINVKLINARQLYDNFKDLEHLTNNFFDDYVNDTLNHLLSLECDYLKNKPVIDTAKNIKEVEKKLKQSVQDYLEKYGIEVENCLIHIAYDEEYQKHIRDVDANYQKENDQFRKTRKEIDLMQKIQDGTNESKKNTKCSFCGNEIDSNNMFCPVCGRKI